jgi:glycosyltransferase involved in cell wall biosynthesis
MSWIAVTRARLPRLRAMTAPLLSVVLPTHNRPAFARQAIESALAQQGVDVEVIAVDDASSDDTPEQLASIGDERLTVIRHDTPRGPAVARNAGIERARGTWVAFLDDDDFFAPSKLGAQVADAERRGAAFSYTGRIEIDENDSVVQRRLMAEQPVSAADLYEDNVVGGPSAVIMRADLLEEIGGFDERLPPVEDWDLWIRAVSSAKASVLPGPLYAYRRHPENFWVTAAARIPDNFEILSEKHGAAAKAAGIEFGSVWVARWTAAQDMASGRRLRATRRLLRLAARHRNGREAARALLALGGARAQKLGMSLVARSTAPPDWLQSDV